MRETIFCWAGVAGGGFDSPGNPGQKRLPGAVDNPLGRHVKPGEVSNEIVSGLDWCSTSLGAAGDPDVKVECLLGLDALSRRHYVWRPGVRRPVLGDLQGIPAKPARCLLHYRPGNGEAKTATRRLIDRQERDMRRNNSLFTAGSLIGILMATPLSWGSAVAQSISPAEARAIAKEPTSTASRS